MGVTVAQCINCKYRHTLSEIECDSNVEGPFDPTPCAGGQLTGDAARANFCKAGINFRLRFLYKSHLPTDSGRSSYYACVFCELSGRTASADDATVFTSQEQLFNHLARHPRPLPEVPDFKVVYGPLDKEDAAFETFDLHFPHAPAANPLADIDPETPKRFPSAVAIADHVNRPNKRDLADPDGGKDDVLEFLAGARIVGVEFPERWGGKWCTGWHNGFHGSFPLKVVILNPPPTSDVRLPGTNNDGVTVTARWKWQPKDADAGWLTFDKNAVISNVSCKCPSSPVHDFW